ncbi:hypothetical protein RHGRI_038615 [Rhododendron griersonianum]|uniref:Uncharacterized protein n=1 Tax=Rhododendron griersonianum TaxID=479676 RepID=A0AAV6HIP0_9ERIC|nr:hypothetical protein RHGRI_038615 [Rhododendron griersonianum]
MMHWFKTFPKTPTSSPRLLGAVIINPLSCYTAIYRTIGDGFARELIKQDDAVVSFPTNIPTVSSVVPQRFFARRLETGTNMLLPRRRTIHVEIKPSPGLWEFCLIKT